MEVAERNPVRLLGIVHRLHMREVFHLYHIEHIKGMNQEVGIEIEVRDAELIVYPDYLQAQFLPLLL